MAQEVEKNREASREAGRNVQREGASFYRCESLFVGRNYLGCVPIHRLGHDGLAVAKKP